MALIGHISEKPDQQRILRTRAIAQTFAPAEARNARSFGTTGSAACTCNITVCQSIPSYNSLCPQYDTRPEAPLRRLVTSLATTSDQGQIKRRAAGRSQDWRRPLPCKAGIGRLLLARNRAITELAARDFAIKEFFMIRPPLWQCRPFSVFTIISALADVTPQDVFCGSATGQDHIQSRATP